MKILLINKFHYLQGGAERAYFDQAKILTEHGHDVAFFSMHHKRNAFSRWEKYFAPHVDYNAPMSFLGKMRSIIRIWYNLSAKRNLEKLLAEFKPDIAHLHNIYHQLSPAIVDALKKYHIPMVMTLHDFKLISPNYTLSNHGKIWEKSKPKKYFNCVLDKCVKNSYSKSLVCAIEAYLHNFLGTYGKIDLFLSPSHFLIDKFKEFVFSGKIVYLRNPLIIQSDIPLRTASADSLKTILYFGRLSHEKGLYLLFQAFSDYLQTSSAQNVILTLAGDGAEKVFLIALAERLRIADKIRFLGQLDYAGLEREKAAADFIILPSTWYENAPYAVLETMAAGKVILASNIGGLPELVSDGKTGFLFIAGNQADLARQISFVINLSLPEKQAIGLRAKDFIATAYSSEKYYVDLMDIYTEILKNHSQSVKE